MADLKHTPGPWDWDLYARGYVLVGAAPAHSSVRQPVVISHASADGRLITAAPELLQALRLHVEFEAIPQDRGGKNGPKGRAWTAFIAARDTAIAKAEGGNNAG